MKPSFILLLLCFCGIIFGQKKYQASTIAFYNVENLYDTIQSCDKINGFLPITDKNYQVSLPEDSCNANPDKINKGILNFENLKNKITYRKQILSDEFTVGGKKLWTKKRFEEKLDRLSKVFIDLGRETSKTAPVIIGLVEVENRQVLESLVANKNLVNYNYGISHFNSFDSRGIDVALLYQQKRFKVDKEERLIVELFSENENREYTRDILHVSGFLDGEKIHFFVNHWPSRRGGEVVSEPKRIKAAEVLKKALDEIRAKDPNAKIICMGDFNDDPINNSIKKVLNTSSEKEKTKEDNYFDPMEKMYKKGIGSLAYGDSMNLFDQMILSPELVKNNPSPLEYFYLKAGVYSPSELVNPSGQYKGYPFRSFAGDNYTGGYSDHFPVYTVLAREIP